MSPTPALGASIRTTKNTHRRTKKKNREKRKKKVKGRGGGRKREIFSWVWWRRGCVDKNIRRSFFRCPIFFPLFFSGQPALAHSRWAASSGTHRKQRNTTPTQNIRPHQSQSHPPHFMISMLFRKINQTGRCRAAGRVRPPPPPQPHPPPQTVEPLAAAG